MTFSYWETGDYPILINPEFSELDKLGLWDTIRICVDKTNLGLASGHGNTHDSITKMMVHHKYSSGMPETYILFKDGDEYFFNLEDVGLGRKVKFRPVLRKLFSDQNVQIIEDIVSIRRQA